MPADLQSTDFTSLTYTQLMNGAGAYFAILGTANGQLIPYDVNLSQFVVSDSSTIFCFRGEIGQLRSANHSLVIATYSSTLARTPIMMGDLLPNETKPI